MKLSEICEADRSASARFLNFKLPARFKAIGLILAIISFLILAMLPDSEQVEKSLLQRALILSLFLVVLSKERVEDEMLVHLRNKAFGFSFLTGVLYAVFLPGVEYVMAQVLGRSDKTYTGMEDFQLLLFMLIVYLSMFHVLKRKA